MNEDQFLKKLKTKYPYVYSLVPLYLWQWIFRNLTNKNL